ncbi:MAG: alanine dehydrogenase, partial [Actinomycetota bacterium]
MIVGVPREVMESEYRVAMTPVGVHELVGEGNTVLIERGAGEGSSIPDERFARAGATLVDTAADVWGDAELILKVKEPQAEEFSSLRKGQILFTYLHLAAHRDVTDALVAAGTVGIAYETVEDDRKML